jgi:hypothetical protein
MTGRGILLLIALLAVGAGATLLVASYLDGRLVNP